MPDLNDPEVLKTWSPKWQGDAPLVKVRDGLFQRCADICEFIESVMNEDPAEKDGSTLKIAGLIHMYRDNLDYVVIYRLSGKLAGVLAMQENIVYAILTMPSARRKGVASTLLEAAIKRSVKLNCDGVITYKPLDDDATAFFVSCGGDEGMLDPRNNSRWTALPHRLLPRKI